MRIKHTLSVLLCLLLLLFTATLMVHADPIPTSGSCGSSVWWEYNKSSHLLTISGSGTMKDYSSSNAAPWYWYKNSITKVKINSEVRLIGSYAFESCTALTTLYLTGGITRIGSNAFQGCTSLVYVSYSSTLGKWCAIDFENSLANPLSCSGSLTMGTSTVTNMVIPNGTTSIGKYAFYGLKELASVSISNSVISIGDYAFCDCTRLSNVTIPDSVKTIGESAFRGCTNVSSVALGCGLTKVGFYAFKDCTKVTDVQYSGTLAQWCAIDFSAYDANPASIAGKLSIGGQLLKNAVIPDGVTEIRSAVFSGCKCLESVTIPDGVTRIGSNAFAGCTALTRLTIPDSVTSIENYAFSDCSTLAEVTLPQGLTYVRSFTFSGCSALKELTVPNGVTSIADYAFQGCKSLTSVIIPQSVTSFGSSVFRGCTSLESMTLPFVGLSADTYGRNRVFGAIFGYTTDYANSSGTVTQRNDPEHDGWGSYNNTRAYYYIPDSLRSITLTNCASIPDGAFDHCTMLTEINIPDSVTSIGYGAFSGCKNLVNVSIPDNVTEIAGYAFSACENITSITIPDGVETIKRGTFSGCDNLNTLTIGSGVKTIEDSAFFWSYGIKELIYNGTKAQWYAIEIERDGNDGLFLTSTNRIYTEEPLTLSDTTLQLRYKDYSKALSASVPVTWTSSDESVCTVDQYGNLFPIGNGTVTITAHSVYGEKTATCEVKVKYSFWQWLIRIFLLGFIWY